MRAIQQDSVIQRLAVEAAERLTLGFGVVVREGFESEILPFVLNRVHPGGGEEEVGRQLEDLEERWEIIGHGMALAAAAGQALESRWRGTGAPFRREAREALCAMVWPDGSLGKDELRTRASRLVQMLQQRFELGLGEQEYQGIWGEMASH